MVAAQCIESFLVVVVVTMMLEDVEVARRRRVGDRFLINGVLVISSIVLVFQAMGLTATVAFYFFAASNAFRDNLSREIFSALYPKSTVKWLRRENALEVVKSHLKDEVLRAPCSFFFEFLFQFHVAIAGSLELLFLVASAFLVAGLAKRIRWLLLPWLILFGVLQMGVIAAVPLIVLQLPKNLKLISVGAAALEAFVLFPWWFATIHAFASLSKSASGGGRALDDDSPYLWSRQPSLRSLGQFSGHRSHHHHRDSAVSLTSVGVQSTVPSRLPGCSCETVAGKGGGGCYSTLGRGSVSNSRYSSAR